jgi:hypothetical protein
MKGFTLDEGRIGVVQHSPDGYEVLELAACLLERCRLSPGGPQYNFVLHTTKPAYTSVWPRMEIQRVSTSSCQDTRQAIENARLVRHQLNQGRAFSASSGRAKMFRRVLDIA